MSDLPTWIWGHKSDALFDVWSIEHVLAGLSVGALVMKASRFARDRSRIPEHIVLQSHTDAVTVLLLAFAWETAEHYMELGLIGLTVANWFAGIEMWGNRMITDPLMVFLGYRIAFHRPRLIWPARIVSASWLIVHVLIFPHSMYLHDAQFERADLSAAAADFR